MQTAAGSPFSTATEMELASRFLEATDAPRLQHAISALIKRARDASGRKLDAATARRLRQQLLDTATRLGFPQIGRLRHAAIRPPQVARGMGVLSRAARSLGVELEGLSPEDKEFEIARRFVRLGGQTARRLRREPASPSCACQGSCGCSSCGGAPADIPDTSNRSHAMHDIDHTKSEYDPELDELDELETDEMEFSDEFDSGELDEMETDAGEYDSGELDELELDETSGPFSEVEEAELAQELLGLSSEAELDQFLGKIFKKAWRGVRGLGKTLGRVARPLGGILKGVAKKLLPVAAGAAGTFFGGPAGAAIGSKIGSVVGNALEAEFEGSPEDREFEAAKTFVRLAGNAAQQAANTSPGAPPVSTAKNAVVSATRNSVQRLRRRRSRGASNYHGGSRRTGRWVRRGNRIILFGV
ncbi:MAG TPA: hypothetical protein VIV63_16430 [Steroidobacteraceae bacterium]